MTITYGETRHADVHAERQYFQFHCYSLTIVFTAFVSARRSLSHAPRLWALTFFDCNTGAKYKYP